MEDVALALVKTAYDYDAYLLRKAMKVLYCGCVQSCNSCFCNSELSCIYCVCVF